MSHDPERAVTTALADATAYFKMIFEFAGGINRALTTVIEHITELDTRLTGHMCEALDTWAKTADGRSPVEDIRFDGKELLKLLREMKECLDKIDTKSEELFYAD